MNINPYGTLNNSIDTVNEIIYAYDKYIKLEVSIVIGTLYTYINF